MLYCTDEALVRGSRDLGTRRDAFGWYETSRPGARPRWSCVEFLASTGKRSQISSNRKGNLPSRSKGGGDWGRYAEWVSRTSGRMRLTGLVGSSGSSANDREEIRHRRGARRPLRLSESERGTGSNRPFAPGRAVAV